MQRARLIPRRAHQDLPFFICRQDLTGIAFGWIGSTTAFGAFVKRAGDRLRLGATVALEFDPDTGKGAERPIVVEGEPDEVLFDKARTDNERFANRFANQLSETG